MEFYMDALVNAVPEVIHQYLQGLMKKKYGLLSMAFLNLLHIHIHMVTIKSRPAFQKENVHRLKNLIKKRKYSIVEIPRNTDNSGSRHFVIIGSIKFS